MKKPVKIIMALVVLGVLFGTQYKKFPWLRGKVVSVRYEINSLVRGFLHPPHTRPNFKPVASEPVNTKTTVIVAEHEGTAKYFEPESEKRGHSGE